MMAMGPKMKIVSVSVLGDVALIKEVARALVDKVAYLKPEILVGPETKVVPLLQEMSVLLELPRYVVCRKGIHGYMVNPVVVEPIDMRNRRVRSMAIDGKDVLYLNGKRVLIVDDVVFTGGSIGAVKELMGKIRAEVVGVAAVFRQGEKYQGDLIFLAKLPVV